MRNKILIATVAIALLAYFSLQTINPASVAQSQQLKNDNLIESSLAYHIGVIAYLYGYPLVEMSQRLHNETHITGHEEQHWSAPLNRLHRQSPDSKQQRRGPDPEMLFFSGWLDLSNGPVLLNVPDTDGRFYSIAVTDMFAAINHVSARDLKPGKTLVAFTQEGWQGELPAQAQRLDIQSDNAWLSGQLRATTQEEQTAAFVTLDHFWLAELGEYNGTKPAARSSEEAPFVDSLAELGFFNALQAALRKYPLPTSQQVLIQQFNRVGFGPDAADFAADTLIENHRTGLEASVKEARKMILASTQRSVDTQNGWMLNAGNGEYADGDIMRRAAAVKGGGNYRDNEMVALARVFDNEGMLLSGSQQYILQFAANSLPPVDAHWSLAVYNSGDFTQTENPIHRYSLSSDAVQLSPDGSLQIRLQHDAPEDKRNWLPVPAGEFVTIVRLYHPGTDFLQGDYQLPALQKIAQ